MGAGASRACGLPDISELRDRVIARLTPTDRSLLEEQVRGRNLEEALSRLRRITALISGEQTVDGLTALQAKELDTTVCQAIVKELDTEGANLAPVLCLAAWAARAGYRLPIELFTVNYDLLLEIALEQQRVPYFDGFVGTIKASFQTELVEAVPGTDVDSVPAFFVRLWKLHGSVNWAWLGDRQVVRLGQPVAEGGAAAIYPSDAKYEESRRVPFIVLQDRFRRALNQPESLVIITGYSFGDAHLNEMIFDAAARRERSEFIAFCYSDIPDMVANRASITPNLQIVTGTEAILGGIRGDWNVAQDVQSELWEDGKFTLRDFGKLAAYLARSSTRESDADTVLRDILRQITTTPIVPS